MTSSSRLSRPAGTAPPRLLLDVGEGVGSSFGTRVTLIPFDGASEFGRVAIDGVAVVARDQGIIDAYGGIDRMAEQADLLSGRRLL